MFFSYQIPENSQCVLVYSLTAWPWLDVFALARPFLLHFWLFLLHIYWYAYIRIRSYIYMATAIPTYSYLFLPIPTYSYLFLPISTSSYQPGSGSRDTASVHFLGHVSGWSGTPAGQWNRREEPQKRDANSNGFVRILQFCCT
jgi:hypothetical protein